MTTAELLVRCLEQEGVEYVFGLPGEEVIDLVDALSRSSVRFITTRHEQGAAFMADVYGRLTGRPGVCLSTLGPGATNLLTGVADANLDHAPLVAITGQVASDEVHKETHQYIDTVSLFQPVTKWSTRIGSPNVVPEVVRKAFKFAQLEKPGAVHITVPSNIASMEAMDEAPLPVMPVEYPVANRAAIEEAARVIADAASPLIIAGNGVVRRRAHRELTALAEKLRVPVANTFMAKGAIDYTNDLSLLTVGLHARDLVMAGLDQADVVIAVGYDMVEYAPKKWNPRRDKRIVHVDVLPSEVDNSYLPAVEVVGDLPQSLAALAEACAFIKGFDGHSELRRVILESLGLDHWDTPCPPLKPQAVLAELRRALGPDDIVVSDVGSHKLWVARMLPARSPGTVIISNGFASMGIAIPGAIAAKLVHPDKNVVAVVGDGGFLMNDQELETARRIGAAIVVLVWVDGTYGMIDWSMQQRFGHASGTTFGNPDFVKFADAFGLPGFRVESYDALAPTLRQALSTGQPTIVEVPIDYRENANLARQMGQLTAAI